jgi:hypothetical protein
MVQAARRLAGVYIIGLLFGERFSVGMIVGSLCSGLGFVLHCWFSCGVPPTSSCDAESKSYNYESLPINNADLLSRVEAEPIHTDAGTALAPSSSRPRDRQSRYQSC